jgi:predicted O-linked N-acetylglucosamine transferase (SPINDLY family)
MGPGISSYFTAKVPGPASSAHESAAEGFKDEGNDYLKAQKYTEAIESYRKAIDAVWPKGKNLHVYYSNRAAARMKRGKTGDNDEAIKDAQLSVKADPTYCKGYNRLGSALEYANRNSEAVIAYKKCLEHEPENATALEALSRINKAVRPSAKAVKASDEGDVICIDEDDNNDDVMIVSESPSSSSSSSLSSSSSSASLMWICQKCTLKNEFKSSLCTACGSSKLKTGSSSSSSSTSNVPPMKSKSTSNKKSNDKEDDEEEDEDDDDDEDDGDDDEDDDDDDDSDEGFGRKKTSTKKRKSVTKDSKKPSKKKR